MIQPFVDRFMAATPALKAALATAHPEDYRDLVSRVVHVIGNPDDYTRPDPERIHQIDDGDYQGTLLFVIGATGYQPDTYWAVKVSYGSCSGCDTLQAISNYSSEPPTEQQVSDYWTLMLHIVQKITEIGGDTE